MSTLKGLPLNDFPRPVGLWSSDRVQSLGRNSTGSPQDFLSLFQTSNSGDGHSRQQSLLLHQFVSGVRSAFSTDWGCPPKKQVCDPVATGGKKALGEAAKKDSSHLCFITHHQHICLCVCLPNALLQSQLKRKECHCGTLF